MYIHINEIWRYFVSRTRIRIYLGNWWVISEYILKQIHVAGEFSFIIEYRATKISFPSFSFSPPIFAIKLIVPPPASSSITIMVMTFDDETGKSRKMRPVCISLVRGDRIFRKYY